MTWAAWTCCAPTRPGHSPKPRSSSRGRLRSPASTARTCSNWPGSIAIFRPDCETRSMPRSPKAARRAMPVGTKIDEVPFDFQRRRVSVLLEHEGHRLLITKGAPEDVIKHAVRYEEPGKSDLLPLDDVARARASKIFEQLSGEGFRALGVAWRELEPDRKAAAAADERELVFAGFVVFS